MIDASNFELNLYMKQFVGIHSIEKNDTKFWPVDVLFDFFLALRPAFHFLYFTDKHCIASVALGLKLCTPYVILLQFV